MKKLIVLGLLLGALSCTTVPDNRVTTEDLIKVENNIQDNGIDLGPNATQGTKNLTASFAMEGFWGLPWGSDGEAVQPITELDGTKTMWMGDNLLLTDTYTEIFDPAVGNYRILNEQIILFTFEEGHLASVSQLVLDQIQDTNTLCTLNADALMEMWGPPTAYNNAMLQWQNADTTIQMFCSSYGPLVNYYSTGWLRRNDGAKPHAAIPLEVIQNARERILGKLKDLENGASKPRGDGQSTQL